MHSAAAGWHLARRLASHWVHCFATNSVHPWAMSLTAGRGAPHWEMTGVAPGEGALGQHWVGQHNTGGR
jgi:hypothetical protein